MRLPETHLRHVRARVSSRDALAVRRDLERLMIGCESPANLIPPGAILCIRRFRDPLPHTLRLGPGSLRPSPRWKEALERQWAEFLAVAARPALGPVSSAPSVLFASEAELLACLALAAAQGRLSLDWWWPGLLRSDELSDWLLRWVRRPPAVPGAVALLARGGGLPAVARQVSAQGARLLFEALVSAFGLAGLADHPPSARSPGGTFVGGEVAESFSSDARAGPPGVGNGNEPQTPHWSEHLPELRAASAPELKRAWVAVALLLERSPRIPREASFPESLTRWLADTGTADYLRQTDTKILPPTGSPAPPGPTSAPPATQSGGHWDPGPTKDFAAAASAPPARRPLKDAGQPNLPPPEPANEATGPDWAALRPRATHASPGPGTIIVTRTAEASESHSVVVRFPTGLGGSFYLLNVALSLSLYGDFTQPLKIGLTLSPWDLLALLADRALGEEFARDPLAEHLAFWAGRPPTEAPDADSSPPLSPERNRPSEWLNQIAEQFEARLRFALPSWPPLPILPRLLRQAAQVESFDRVIRVRFSLDDHPLAVRIAGLDRDPGWIPAAGRSVTFLYEPSEGK